MFNFVPQAYEEIYICSNTRRSTTKEFRETCTQFPGFPITIQYLKASPMRTLSIEWLDTSFEEDCVEKASPGNTHQNDKTT